MAPPLATHAARRSTSPPWNSFQPGDYSSTGDVCRERRRPCRFKADFGDGNSRELSADLPYRFDHTRGCCNYDDRDVYRAMQ
jgi:hypothetical protein